MNLASGDITQLACVASYFFFGCRCESALAAAVLLALLVRPSRSTFEAALAALALVVFPPLLPAIFITPFVNQ
jgi:hypothetical protein